MKRRATLSILLLILLGTGLWSAWGRLGAPSGFHGTFFEPSIATPDFELAAARGAFGKADLEGYVAAVFFGFTRCPHICPATLTRLAQAMKALGSERKNVKVVMVTVDPERDTAAVVDAYVRGFDEAFIGLSGTKESIQKVASSFGIFYAKAVDSSGEDPIVDHTSAVTVLDRKGGARILWNGSITGAQMADDLRRLILR